MDKFSHSFFDICTSFANETTLRIFFNKGTATYRELLDGEVDSDWGFESVTFTSKCHDLASSTTTDPLIMLH